MRKFIYMAMLMSGCIFLSGCATNADTSQMTVAPVMPQKIKNQALLNNVNVSSVKGGHETNPLWMSQINNANFEEALKNSLRYARLYQNNNAKYNLDVNLIELKQPYIGLNYTVECQAHYRLQNVDSNKIIFDKDITSSYTAKFQDSLYAVTRLKMANEGAARANINEFIQEVYLLPKR